VILLADDLREMRVAADLACLEIVADTGQHDRLRSVSFVAFTSPFDHSATTQGESRARTAFTNSPRFVVQPSRSRARSP
jgi:hypothetical protein